MITWTGILTIINMVIMVGTALGVYVGYRSGKIRSQIEVQQQAAQMQERVRQAMHDENEILQNRVKRLEADNKHLNDMLFLVMDTLKKTRGITLEIDTASSIVMIRGNDGTIQVSRLPDEQSGK